ncbi:MAG: hypothetical protein ACLTF2_08295 [Clostridia bacterium]
MSIASFEQLKDITQYLWLKAKAKIEAIANDYVSKTQENLVEGKTILQDGYIDGVLYSVNNPNATDDNYTRSNTVYSGTSNRTIPVGQHVTTIVIGLRSSIDVGSTVTGINVGVVRKSDNVIIEYLHRNITSVALENKYTQINSTRIVNVNINKKWNEEIYFIVGANGMVWQEPHRDTGLTAVTGGDNLRPVGSVINNLNRTNYIGKIVVLGKAIKLETLNNKVDLSDVANVANKIPRIGENGKLDPSILPAENNGGVRTVNDQSPGENGNVTVLAEHIKYHDNTEMNIKQAIDGKPNTVNGQGQSNGNITIYSDNITIDSSNPNKNIKQALEERAQKNQDNIFTKHNSFNDYSPTVRRLFTRKHINSNATGNTEAYPVNTYFAILNEKYTENNKQISHILIPIKNSQVGDVLDISFFTFNNNNQVNYIESYTRRCTVIDEEILGHKCAKIQVDRNSGTSGIGFGFMNMTHSINGRQLGVACIRNTANGNKIWSQIYSPRDGQSLSPNTNATIPYKICYETTSEVVTRFELENVTQMYPRNMIGEMKQLAYDGGTSFEDETNTWLRANGQAINSNDYPELYEKFNTPRTDDIEVSIPDINSQVGYYYICAK